MEGWHLPNFKDMRIFGYIRQKMHIPRDMPVDFSLDRKLKEIDWDDVLLQGLEITTDDKDFEILDDGFSYRGKRVIVYIRDQLIQYRGMGNGYKYHLTWCRTLEDMKERGRFNKYVVSTNSDGNFAIRYVDDDHVVEETIEPLHVCKNCLKALNWKGYAEVSRREQKEIYESFDLEEFFRAFNDDNETQFHIMPNETDMSAPTNVYPEEWSIISKRYKHLKNMTCEMCGRHFDATRELHVHHKDGVKSNVTPSNLMVLCPECHQKMHPDHKIMKFDLPF